MTFSIPPLISGGLMLTYRCTNSCRHCLYRCSPKKADDWITLETAEKAFEALSREGSLDSLHISGGEATLKMDLLVDVIQMANKMNVPLSYLETNASWCTNLEKAEERFSRLKSAGLPAVLVSTSMFHNEFVPFRKMRIAAEAAFTVFGANGVILWLPNLYQALSDLGEEERPRTLEAFCERTGLTDRMELLPPLYHLIPGGRVVDALRECYTPRKARAFQGASCYQDLSGTTHFHIDPFGNLFTGLCAGIVAGNVDDLHPEITREERPVFYTLCAGGPYALMEEAKQRYEYQENARDYISKCDLCIDVRKHLRSNEPWDELQPNAFYED